MSDCFCTKKYQCLSCERAENNGKLKGQVTAIRRVSPRKEAACGTRAGYNRHLRLGEPTCDLCRSAQSKAVNNFNKSKRTAI